jgi:hypothetical protein
MECEIQRDFEQSAARQAVLETERGPVFEQLVIISDALLNPGQ